MGGEQTAPTGPDLAQGVALSDVPDGGMLAGHVGEEAVLLIRRGAEVFAVGAHCTHYGGPLAEGLVVGETLRCPWHHACFSLRTGEALWAPAFDPIPCWRVEQRDGKVLVRDRLQPPTRRAPARRASSRESASKPRAIRRSSAGLPLRSSAWHGSRARSSRSSASSRCSPTRTRASPPWANAKPALPSRRRSCSAGSSSFRAREPNGGADRAPHWAGMNGRIVLRSSSLNFSCPPTK